MEFIGNLIKKVAEREGDGQNGHWKIASYLLETVEMYPKRMVVDVSDGQMARVAQWDGMIGKNVVIQFDIDARECQGKWFNSLRAWAIKENQPSVAKEPATKQVAQNAVAGQDPFPPQTQPAQAAEEIKENDLPF